MASHEGCTYKRGRVWWISFYDHDGRQYQQSTGTRDRKEARRILRRKLGELDKGRPVSAPTRITVRKSTGRWNWKFKVGRTNSRL